jgi:hypothetical protein
MSDPIERVRLGAVIAESSNGTHSITIQIGGLSEMDALRVGGLLQPTVNSIVAEVLKERGNVFGDYEPQGKPN